MYKRFSLCLFVIFLISISTSYAEISDFDDEKLLDEVHVDINGSDENQGDFQHPLHSLKQAINISSNNSKIIIHEGVYKQNNITINKSIEIYGIGNVILDGGNENRIFTINTPTSSIVSLSNLTFINGFSNQMAGAIYVLGAKTIINNCKFINNTASNEAGAIFWNSQQGILNNSLFESNTARDGAAVKWGESDTSLSLGDGDGGNIINCTFENNHLTQDEDACIGIAVYSNNVAIVNSTFKNHKTRYNSSFEVLYINGDSAYVEGCLFINNSLTLAGALGLDGNYAVVKNNLFINNTLSFLNSFGSAIGIQSETALIHNNTFISNGGFTTVGGAIFINIMEDYQFSFINITNNIFNENYAFYGGDIYANGQGCMLDLKIINNTFTSTKSEYGSGIYVGDIWSPVLISNNTFSNHTSNNSIIYSHNCILDISKNKMYNCSSRDLGSIFSTDEIKGNLKLKFNNVCGVVNKTTYLTATLVDDMDNTVSTYDINFKINNQSISVNKGLNNVSYIFTSFGNYTISGDYEYGCENVEESVISVLYNANLDLKNITNYGNNVNLIFKLYDDNLKPIPNKEILLNINSNTFLVKTNQSGDGLIAFKLDFGIHNLTAMFFDDDYYKSVNTTSFIEILSSIIGNDTQKSFNSGFDFKAQLFDNDGSPLINTNVSVKINSINYNIKTDNNGFLVINKRLNPRVYAINILNPETNEESLYTLTITKRILNNQNIQMYYGANTYYKILLLNDEGQAVKAGEIAIINIAGKNYYIKSDKNGYVSFKINLKANNYTIKTTYKGYTVVNKIIIKAVLTAKSITVKKSKKIKFQAKLLNTKGFPLKSKKITFKINKHTYKIKTNKKGIAKLYIKNLKIGKYTITSKYGKSLIKNTIKVKR